MLDAGSKLVMAGGSDIVCINSDADDASDTNTIPFNSENARSFRLDPVGNGKPVNRNSDLDDDIPTFSPSYPGSPESNDSSGSAPIYHSEYRDCMSSNNNNDDSNGPSDANNQEESSPVDPCPQGDSRCFNCDGTDHVLSKCPFQKNQNKIREAFKQFNHKKNPGPQRYHKAISKARDFAVPGKITDELRNGLNLEKNQLPPHVYKMREHGYPPGWKEAARITPTGLQLIDEESRELELERRKQREEAEKTPQYNPDKVVVYPGFNDPVPQGYTDVSRFSVNTRQKKKQNKETERYGVPPYSNEYSRENLVKRWAAEDQMSNKRTYSQMSRESPTNYEGERHYPPSPPSDDMWGQESSTTSHYGRRNPKEPRIANYGRSNRPNSNNEPPDNYQSNQYFNPNNTNNHHQSYGGGSGEFQQQPYGHQRYPHQQQQQQPRHFQGNPSNASSINSFRPMQYDNDIYPPGTLPPRNETLSHSATRYNSNIRSSSSQYAHGQPPTRFENPLMSRTNFPIPASSAMGHYNNSTISKANVPPPAPTPTPYYRPNGMRPYNPQRFSHNDQILFRNIGNRSMGSSKKSSAQKPYYSASSGSSRSKSPSLLEQAEITEIDIRPPSPNSQLNYQRQQQQLRQQSKRQQVNQHEERPNGEPDKNKPGSEFVKNPLYNSAKSRPSQPPLIPPEKEDSDDDVVEIIDTISPAKEVKAQCGEAQKNKKPTSIEVIDLDDSDSMELDEEPQSSPEVVGVMMQPSTTMSSSSSSCEANVLPKIEMTSSDTEALQAAPPAPEKALIPVNPPTIGNVPESMTLPTPSSDADPASTTTMTDDNVQAQTEVNKNTEEQAKSNEIEDNDEPESRQIPQIDDQNNVPAVKDQRHPLLTSAEGSITDLINPNTQQSTTPEETADEIPPENPSDKEQTSVQTESTETGPPLLIVKEEIELPQISISKNIFERESDTESAVGNREEEDEESNMHASCPIGSVIQETMESDVSSRVTEETLGLNNSASIPLLNTQFSQSIETESPVSPPQNSEYFQEAPASPEDVNNVETKAPSQEVSSISTTAINTDNLNESTNSVDNTSSSPKSPENATINHQGVIVHTRNLVASDSIEDTLNSEVAFDSPSSPDPTTAQTIENHIEGTNGSNSSTIIPTETAMDATNTVVPYNDKDESDSPMSPEQQQTIGEKNEENISRNSSIIIQTEGMIMDTTTDNAIEFDSPQSPDQSLDQMTESERGNPSIIIPTENVDTTAVTNVTLDPRKSPELRKDGEQELFEYLFGKQQFIPPKGNKQTIIINRNNNDPTLVQQPQSNSLSTPPVNSLSHVGIENDNDLPASGGMVYVENSDMNSIGPKINESSSQLLVIGQTPDAVGTSSNVFQEPSQDKSGVLKAIDNNNKRICDNTEDSPLSTETTNTNEPLTVLATSDISSISFPIDESSNVEASTSANTNVSSEPLLSKSTPTKKKKFTSLPPLEKFAVNMINCEFPEDVASQRLDRIFSLIRSRKSQFERSRKQ